MNSQLIVYTEDAVDSCQNLYLPNLCVTKVVAEVV